MAKPRSASIASSTDCSRASRGFQGVDSAGFGVKSRGRRKVAASTMKKKIINIHWGVAIFINYSLYYSLYSTNFPQYITIYRVGCWKLIALQAGQIQPNFRKVLRNVSGLVCPLCHEMLEELGMGSLRPPTSQPNGL